MQGLSLDSSLLPSLATARVPVATLSSPTDYGFDSHNVWDVPGALLQDAIGSLGGARSDDPTRILTQASRDRASSRTSCAASSAASSARTARRTTTPKAKYPGRRLRARLAGLAALLARELPDPRRRPAGPGLVRHALGGERAPRTGAERGRAGLAAFQADLEQRNLGDRVATLLWSEFGRRAEQNDSNGTDHGAAGVAFLMGKRVRHKMVGEFPGLSQGRGLDADGNLKETVDFRAVYSSLAEQWFDVDGDRILPDGKKMKRLSLLA